jgi:hypothetical protein
VTVVETHHVARELDDRHLHAEADAEERCPGLARRPDGLHHALDAAHAEAARHEHAVEAGRSSRARGVVKRSLDVHAISTPTSFAMPPWMSASCTLL